MNCVYSWRLMIRASARIACFLDENSQKNSFSSVVFVDVFHYDDALLYCSIAKQEQGEQLCVSAECLDICSNTV